jgi:hypothetical protein
MGEHTLIWITLILTNFAIFILSLTVYKENKNE